ncbi:hypothetical protein [Burkholderia sp. Ac-20353]|uniref:hypothetical protein n=1 Tax=Burkholderia sp. Ac-20353 TaxID=2703894 RepID=UPI00197B7A9A|nr:hypothetical protein [Burkholderia sp. Ac-20353]MBN3791872.1 hypothetical protein [Burkholderia sp. Ac-20353]
MLILIAVLLFLILLAVAAHGLLLKLALVVAWPIDMALLIVRVPLWALGVVLGFFFNKVLPVLQNVFLWFVVALLVLGIGANLVSWAIHGMPARPFN